MLKHTQTLCEQIQIITTKPDFEEKLIELFKEYQSYLLTEDLVKIIENAQKKLRKHREKIPVIASLEKVKTHLINNTNNTSSSVISFEWLQGLMIIIAILLIVMMVTYLPIFAMGATAVNIGKQDTNLVPCGRNLKQYLPEKYHSLEGITTQLLAVECQNRPMVTEQFNRVNARAFSSSVCIRVALEVDCKRAFGLFSPKKLEQLAISPNANQVTLVHEGQFAIVSTKNTILTSHISSCVAVSLTNSDSTKVLLAHINSENIKASDIFLVDTSTRNPFIPIADFVKNLPSENWEATLVSGDIVQTAYIRSILESFGINKISVHLNTDWAASMNNPKMVNGGSLVVQEGKVFALKNRNDFKSLMKLLDKAEKNKPLMLINANPESESETDHVCSVGHGRC